MHFVVLMLSHSFKICGLGVESNYLSLGGKGIEFSAVGNGNGRAVTH